MSYQQEPPQIGFKNSGSSRPLGFSDVGSPHSADKNPPIGFKSSEHPRPVEAVSMESLHKESGRSQSPGGEGKRRDRDIASASGVHTKEKKSNSVYFNDGERRIDWVLTYKISSDAEKEHKNLERRKAFLDSLRDLAKVQLEEQSSEASVDKVTNYIKIHAPWTTLLEYAEIMRFNMPIKESALNNDHEFIEPEPTCQTCPSPFELDSPYLEKDYNPHYTCAFKNSAINKFLIEDRDTFFTSAQRSAVVDYILKRVDYKENDRTKFGAYRLISKGAFEKSFPLHDGPSEFGESLLTHAPENDRQLLRQEWARPGRWYKFQPLDLVRKYFGEKIGIYFAWLGFYTGMLIPASILGVLCFLYGLFTMGSNKVSSEICSYNLRKQFYMCPLCDELCPYWELRTTCNYAKASTLFLEFWKRRQARIAFEWDLLDYEAEEEPLRAQYEAKCAEEGSYRVNPVTGHEEPYFTPTKRLPRYFVGDISIVFMICLVIAAVFAVIIYRLGITYLLLRTNIALISQAASIFTSITAAAINLVVIMLLGVVYKILAYKLTDWERYRTQSEYDRAFTVKMFLFQFVNYYSSLFYIAFFKGTFSGSPNNYNRSLLGLRQQQCSSGGCLVELCIQLAIIMVGKQAWNNILEFILPKIKNWIARRNIDKEDDGSEKDIPLMEEDEDLQELGQQGLFFEYLEMVIQFGFITLFVAAFPLAPFFALLNNIIEIRLDAYKFITQLQRPLAAQAPNIGAWYGILDSVSKMAVITNAFVIAVTSDFIPRMVYEYGISQSGTLDGYVNFSLSYFNVTDFPSNEIPKANLSGQLNYTSTFCRYSGYRQTEYPYSFNLNYWRIMTARLAFVVVFEHLIFFIKFAIGYAIPDIPKSLRLTIKREEYLAKQALEDDKLVRNNSNA
ncbi:Anoctamin-4 [Trichoplax sp. H2]|nr:Anoctamin-4 [Trichoplax sp. H2]|eukprot:RDD39920.1 Anoctamin-4 [Trichoplax sp. H2]